jgi:hypothetical protein
VASTRRKLAWLSQETGSPPAPADSLWEQGVASSNLAVPTSKGPGNGAFFVGGRGCEDGLRRRGERDRGAARVGARGGNEPEAWPSEVNERMFPHRRARRRTYDAPVRGARPASTPPRRSTTCATAASCRWCCGRCLAAETASGGDLLGQRGRVKTAHRCSIRSAARTVPGFACSRLAMVAMRSCKPPSASSPSIAERICSASKP